MNTVMKKIAFLGIGAMGFRMVQQLLKKDHVVHVWNRTPEAAEALVKDGAQAFANIQAAVSDVDYVISMVRDDVASAEIWTGSGGALNHMPSQAIAIECSTVSQPHITKLHKTFQEAEIQFVDAPLAGSRPQAEAAQLIFFVGAEKQVFAKVEPVLDSMGSQVHHAGAPGAGVVVKLMVNALLGTQLAVMAELLNFAERAGMEPSDALEMIATTPVCSPAAKVSATAMLNKQFTPAFPIELVLKDFELISTSAQKVIASAPLCTQVKSIFQQAVDAGFATDNITAVARLYGAKKH